MPPSITSTTQIPSFAAMSSTEANKTMNCSASWSSWLNRSILFSLGQYATFHSTRTYYNMTAEVTTFCDGHTRIVGGIDGLTTTATGTTIFLTSGQSTPTGDFTASTPTCLPGPADRTNIFDGFFVWVPRTEPYIKSQHPSTLPSSLVAHGRICGHCSIFGGTVSCADISNATSIANTNGRYNYYTSPLLASPLTIFVRRTVRAHRRSVRLHPLFIRIT